jgi:hypothetical protein
MNKELIAKVKDGVAAVRNDGIREKLDAVIGTLCPNDITPGWSGLSDAKYFFLQGEEWRAVYSVFQLPSRITEIYSVSEFFVGEEKPREVELRRTPEMSKRFRAACIVAQGFAARQTWHDPHAIAAMAYRVADELIKQENEK